MKKFLYIILVFLSTSLIAAPYLAKDYSHLLGKLKGINDPLLKMHFTLYQGYVKNVNTLEDALVEMRNGGQIKRLPMELLKDGLSGNMMGWSFMNSILRILEGKESFPLKVLFIKK